MYNFIDNLIFPAPRPGYTTDTLSGKIIFIPKFKDYFQVTDTDDNTTYEHENICVNAN